MICELSDFTTIDCNHNIIIDVIIIIAITILCGTHQQAKYHNYIVYVYTEWTDIKLIDFAMLCQEFLTINHME